MFKLFLARSLMLIKPNRDRYNKGLIVKTYYVYMLECSNGHYYVGYTTDIERRYREHQEGSSKCKYTRSFPPKRIVVCWAVNSLSQALKLERYLKKLSKDEKSHVTSLSQAEISGLLS